MPEDRAAVRAPEEAVLTRENVRMDPIPRFGFIRQGRQRFIAANASAEESATGIQMPFSHQDVELLDGIGGA